MKKAIIIILLIWVYTKIYSQTNLVNNGDFENYTSIPLNFGSINLATGWNNLNVHYQYLNYANPDYYYIGGFMGFGIGFINPYSGNGQAGLCWAYNNGLYWREYISTFLITSLDTGRMYNLSFYIYHNIWGYTNSPSSVFSQSCNNLGIHFSTNSLVQNTSEPIFVNPQVEIDTMINYTNNWVHFTL